MGIEVFGRDPTYDTNLDPVVRTSATQIRQRLNQYYLDPSHESEVRIELLPGSYVPQFRFPVKPESHVTVIPRRLELPAADALTFPQEVATAPVEPTTAAMPRRHHRFVLCAVCAGVLAVTALAWVPLTKWISPDPVEKFWGPLWDRTYPVVICLPGKFPSPASVPQISGGVPGKPLTICEALRLNSIAWPDATTFSTLAGFIQARGQSYQVRRAGDSALSDFRRGPSVFIGGFNNPWLMRLTSRYRFTYQRDPVTQEAWIQDAQNPSRRDWIVNFDAPYPSFDQDYGVISRVWDSTTERIVVVASGIASYGTIEAGELLTNPKHFEMFAQRAPAGWERKNLQVVFATKVFEGNAGPPRILASHVW